MCWEEEALESRVTIDSKHVSLLSSYFEFRSIADGLFHDQSRSCAAIKRIFQLCGPVQPNGCVSLQSFLI